MAAQSRPRRGRVLLSYVTSQASRSLERVVSKLPGDLDISVVVHQSTSIPTGLTDLAAKHEADLVVVGSSSSGLLGRVGLGSVTDRLVHTAAVPVAIAPRGYPMNTDPVSRLTAAYGGPPTRSASSRLVPSWPSEWSVRLRIVSFTVRPVPIFAGSIEPSVEDLVIRTVVAPDVRRYRQAAQRCPRSHSDSRRRRGDRNRLRLARGGGECLLGNRRHAGAGFRSSRSGGSGISLALPPRRSCGTLPFR